MPPLTCIALWNSESALSGDDGLNIWGDDYLELINKPENSTPNEQPIRVALVAPAMPSSHFIEFTKRTGKNDNLPENYERIIIGHNQNDAATGKSFLPASWFGATTLGVSFSEYCDGVVPKVGLTTTITALVDFTQSLEAAKLKRAHGINQFMKADHEFKTLVDLWLNDTMSTNTSQGIKVCP